MSNLRRIMQKVNEEEPSDDNPSLDKTNARNSASLMRNKSAHVGHIREGREGAYLYRSRRRCGPAGLAAVCAGVSAVRGLRMRPCRRCHTAGTASRRCAQAQPLSAALLGAGSARRPSRRPRASLAASRRGRTEGGDREEAAPPGQAEKGRRRRLGKRQAQR